VSKLPEAFKGHDLTGWTAYGHYILRSTRLTTTLRIWACDDGLFEVDILNEVFTPTRAILSECLLDADALAADYGGWAPAPIGYSADPGWQPIETAIHLRSEPDVLGCQVYSGGVQYFVMKNAFEPCEKFTHAAKGSHWMADGRDWPAYPTHWRPLPAPPEAKP